MNIVYMGTPAYALPALDALAQEHEVRAVFSRPDAVSHRGRKLHPSPVKARALELGIPVHTPESFFVSHAPHGALLNTEGTRVLDAELLASIERCNPDLIIVAAYGSLLPPEILSLPTYGCINLHASLLPRWRGAAPIQRAILAGDEETGVSIMRMETGLDTGPYCLQETTLLENKRYEDLVEELGEMGAKLLVPHLEAIVSNQLGWVEQDEALVTYADKVQKGSIDLDPSLSVQQNYNRVRASSPHARCRTELHGRQVTVLEVEPASQYSAKGLYVSCSDGTLEILCLKPDGSREMTGRAFLAGVRSGS